MKKLLVVLLAAAMCVSLLAGCTGSGNNSSSTPESQSSSQSSSSAPSSSSSEASQSSSSQADPSSSEPAGNVDLQDFTVMGDNSFYTYFDMNESMEEFYAWQELRRLMEAQGINLVPEYVADDQYQTTLQTRFAAMNDIPMFCYYNLSDAEALQIAQNGLVQDINELLPLSDGTALKYFTENEYGKAAKAKVSTPEGQFYWLPNIYITVYDGQDGVGTNATVGIRKDWLDKYSLELPTTLDDFTTALKTFNEQDPSSSGANAAGINVYSYNPCSFNDKISGWFGLVLGNVVNVDWDAQKATSPWVQEGFDEYITYISNLYSQGLYDAEMLGSNSTLSTKIANNQVGATSLYALTTTYEPRIKAAHPELGDEVLYADLMPITAIEGVTPLLGLEDPVYMWDHFLFTSKLTSKELGAAFLDAYYSDASIDLINWGVEGVTYEVVNGEKQYIKYTSDDPGEPGEYEADQLNQFLQDKADKRLRFGKILYARTVLPDNNFYRLDKAAANCYEGVGWAAQKGDYQAATLHYGHWTSLDVEGTLATASLEEINKYNELYNDLYTASQEEVANLVNGAKTVADIPTIVESLNALGLQDIIEIFQNRYNRFKGL